MCHCTCWPACSSSLLPCSATPCSSAKWSYWVRERFNFLFWVWDQPAILNQCLELLLVCITDCGCYRILWHVVLLFEHPLSISIMLSTCIVADKFFAEHRFVNMECHIHKCSFLKQHSSSLCTADTSSILMALIANSKSKPSGYSCTTRILTSWVPSTHMNLLPRPMCNIFLFYRLLQ